MRSPRAEILGGQASARVVGMTKPIPTPVQRLAYEISADLGKVVVADMPRAALADSIAAHLGCDRGSALLVIADLTAHGYLIDADASGRYHSTEKRRIGRWMTGKRVPDELVEAAIAASPGLSAGYSFSDQDLRTDLRDALAGALAMIHPRPRFLRFGR
jgi:hypothetical protein